MVSTRPVDPVLVDEVRGRISGLSYRFLSVDDRGRMRVRFDGLAELVAEIVAERSEHVEVLRAELAAANDAVVELIGQHDAAVHALDTALGSRSGGA